MLLGSIFAPLDFLFSTFSIILKVLSFIPQPFGILLSLAIGIFAVRIIVGLL
jgi:hypothetical protein